MELNLVYKIFKNQNKKLQFIINHYKLISV